MLQFKKTAVHNGKYFSRVLANDVDHRTLDGDFESIYSARIEKRFYCEEVNEQPEVPLVG